LGIVITIAYYYNYTFFLGGRRGGGRAIRGMRAPYPGYFNPYY
jgi:hypothetical protein